MPDGEPRFVTARLEIVIRRYGFEVEPVLWQMVILLAGVLVLAGVSAAAGHAAVPTTIASPVWRRWPRSRRPDCDFGFVTARLETLIRRHGFEAEPVSWQIVILVGGATVRVVASWPCAAAAAPASSGR